MLTSMRVRRFKAQESLWFLTAGCLWWSGLSSGGMDWPQYRGPDHAGVSTDRILKPWSGPVTNPVWRVSLGNGLGSVAVSGGRLLTQVRRNLAGVDQEVCLALNATNGVELWATPVDVASYPGGSVGSDDGPRTTPSVDAGSVYILSSYLKLLRLNAADGAVVWSNDLRVTYGGDVIAWQNAASPLVDHGLIFVNANCGTRTLLALRTSDGGLVWRSQDEALTHSTPVLATIRGAPQLIFATQTGLVSLDPSTGDRLWQFAYPFSYSTCLAASPVVDRNVVFICGAQNYGMGSVALRVSLTNETWSTTQLWSSNNPASIWMTPVCQDGFLYGQFGSLSFDGVNAQLKCVELRTGEVKWSANGFGRGGTLLVDHHILTLTERGELVLTRPDTNAYTEIARLQAITNYSASANKCWNVPAVCDGRVYVRSTAQLACFDLALPDLRLDPPERLDARRFQLTVRTTNGAPVNEGRLAGLAVQATTNLSLAVTQWTRLTNALRLTNGAVQIENVDAPGDAQRYFIVSEPP